MRNVSEKRIRENQNIFYVEQLILKIVPFVRLIQYSQGIKMVERRFGELSDTI
jgi:hypothetical protein